jgi:hypothetical protein
MEYEGKTGKSKKYLQYNEMEYEGETGESKKYLHYMHKNENHRDVTVLKYLQNISKLFIFYLCYIVSLLEFCCEHI